MVDYEFATEEQVRAAKETLSRVVAMLVGMIRSLEKRDSRTMARR